MVPYLFLDIDEVLSTFKSYVSTGETGGVRQSLDITLVKLLDKAIPDGCQIVISSVWRYAKTNYEKQFFIDLFNQYEGYQIVKALENTEYCFTDNLHNRTEEIDNYISQHCANNDVVVILDDGFVDSAYTTGYVRVTTPYDGLSFENYLEIDRIFTDKTPNVNL